MVEYTSKTRINATWDLKVGDVLPAGGTVTQIDGSKAFTRGGVNVPMIKTWITIDRPYQTRFVNGEEVTLHHPDEKIHFAVATDSGHQGRSYRTCRHDGASLRWFWIDRGSGSFQAWRHVDGTYCANGSHGPDPVTVATCPKCLAVDSMKTTHEAYADRVSCTLCDYEASYPIGD